MNTEGANGQPDRQIDLHVDKVQLEITPALRQQNSKSQKDLWDKLSCVSTFVGGTVVVLIGIYATSVYNARQLDNHNLHTERELSIQRVQTVERFFPHLISDNPKQRLGALDAIGALGDEELATRLAVRFGGEGGAAALATLSRSENPKIATSASKALGDLFAGLRSSVFVLESVDRSSRGTRRSTGFFIAADGLAVVPSYAVDGHDHRARLDNSGELHDVSVIQQSEESRLALVKVLVPSSVAPMPLSDADVRQGEAIVAIGAPGGESIHGHVVSIKANAFFSSFPLKPGMGGVPVTNTRSECVGMGFSSDGRTSLIVPAREITAFVVKGSQG